MGTSLGGQDEATLRRTLSSLAPRAEKRTAYVLVQSHSFDVTAGEVGATVDIDATARRALTEGKDGSWAHQLAWFFARPFRSRDLPPLVRFDEAKLEAKLVGMERSALGAPEVEGSLAFDGRVAPTYPKEGLAIAREGAKSVLRESFFVRNGVRLLLPVTAKTPRLTKAEVDAALAEATRSVGTPVALKGDGEQELAWNEQDLGHALRTQIAGTPPKLDVFFDREALREVIARGRATLERPARDATFNVDAKRAVALVPSELGVRLDDDVILDRVIQLTKLPGREERQGQLVFRQDVAPKLTTEQAEALHVKGLVSSYRTPFPCCEARVKNIERMAALVNGSIVQPGEQFSINARSGPRTAANGFVGGPTIVEGEMEMTIGGGVSQFATTIFNAAFDGGYEIIQRQAHTYWFPRYPEGHDATLGYPLPDLIFRNDSEAGIFVKCEVGKNYVRVEFYGDNGGRKVTRSVSPRFDVIQPETILEPNPELSPDETKVKFGGWIGWSVNVSRTIAFSDGTKKEERRKVTYSPRARRVETHPCHIPEGAPGHTGEKCPKVEHPDGGT
jgi:vancomycin resistance protein YoaR